MISSGMKRGLAATAISAMAVTGLPLLASSASAAPLSSDAGGADQVVLYSQFGSNKVAALPSDGENTSVSLTAGGGSDIAKVNFSYSLDGTNYTPITSDVTRNARGDFETEWTPSALLNGATVTLKIEGFTAAAPATAADTVLKPGIQIVGGLSGNQTVEVDSSAPIAVFQQPYAAPNDKDLANVSGTTSATDGTVAVSARSGGATGTASAPVTAGGTWSTVLDLSGYQYGSFADANANQIVIGAVRDTDDAEANTIRNQSLVTGTVSAVASGPAPAGGTTSVTVTVNDSTGAPIVGAQVYDTNGNRLIGYTDANGQVKDTGATGGNHTYYANSTANPAYEAGIDPSSGTVVVNTYIGTPTTDSATSEDGSAFDFDEYSAGDTYVTVLDQNGNPVANRTVEYKWSDTPFAGGTAVTTPTTGYSVATTDASGKAIVAFPTGSPSGTFTLSYRVPADGNGQGAIAEKSDLVVKAGQAKLVEAPVDQSYAASDGTPHAYTATLKLEDGTALAGRDVTFTYTRGTEKAPADGTADAGIVPDAPATALVLTKTVKTDNTGVATVDVKDPQETAPAKAGSELGGKLDAATSNTAPTKTNTLDGNAGASDSTKVNFVSANSIDKITLTETNAHIATPGRPVTYTVQILDDAGNAVPNKTVTVDIDHGFLYQTDTNGNPLPDTTTPESGDFLHAASQTTVTTDVNGNAYIAWGMEREAGFDDDGAVEGNIKVTYMSVSSTKEKTFFSGNETGNQLDPANGQIANNGNRISPLNIDSVDMKFASDDQQQSSILPKASTNQRVALDLIIKDQYGNLTKVYPDDVYDNTNQADVYSVNDYVSQFANEKANWVAYANDAVDQRIFTTASGSAQANGAVADASPVDINWYVVDFSKATFTIDHDTADSVPVGTAVTETVTARDQEGQPIPGLDVDFLRSGPNAQSGDVNSSDVTDGNGQATYNFVGDTTGTAKIDAVVSDGNGGQQITKLHDEVVFKSVAPAIFPGITAEHIVNADTISGYDRITVRCPKAGADAVVKLYRVKNGVAKRVKSKTIGADGVARFKRADLNGDKKNYYFATVSASSSNKAGKTKTVAVK